MSQKEWEVPPINWNTQSIDKFDQPAYTLARLTQLQDVHERIDRERYPERFRRLKEELNSRLREALDVEYRSEMPW